MTTSEASLDRLVQAIADPTRRRILQTLKPKTSRSAAKERDKGLCASDIETRIRLSQPTISHHMAILEKVGLIESHKERQWRWYRRNESAIRAFSRRLRETL